MSRTTRRDYRGRTLRDGQWSAQCPDGRRCDFCGPAAQLPYKVPAPIRSLDALFAEYDVTQVRSPWTGAVYTFLDAEAYAESFEDDVYDECGCCCCTGSCNEVEDTYEWTIAYEVEAAWWSLESDTYEDEDVEVRPVFCPDCGSGLRKGRCLLAA